MRKNDGTIHFCLDYRKLIDVTHKDAYPLPRIDDILGALPGAKYFCSIDLAYWLLADQSSRERQRKDGLLFAPGLV